MDMDEEIINDRMWYHWRKLYSYIECLKDEDTISDKTWTTMNDSLMELKSLLPSEDD